MRFSHALQRSLSGLMLPKHDAQFSARQDHLWDLFTNASPRGQIAAWLQYRAVPGALLTSEAIMQLAHDVVQDNVHGEVHLPGQSATVRYACMEPSHTTTHSSTPHRPARH